MFPLKGGGGGGGGRGGGGREGGGGGGGECSLHPSLPFHQAKVTYTIW